MQHLSSTLLDTGSVSISNFLTTESNSEIIEGIYCGLASEQKKISSRFFYDEVGSELFEKITTLDEYYPTRAEKQILEQHALNFIDYNEAIDIIELGSGDCSKISLLLDHIPAKNMSNTTYIAVDVSESAILKSAHILYKTYADIKVHGILADFMKHLHLLPRKAPRLICFFGSTLGNLDSKQMNAFMLNLKNELEPGDRLLLGLDMVKDKSILHNAYNDAKRVTEQFNKNILNVVNQVAKTNFQTNDFAHQAFYNESQARIEMHLLALRDVRITSMHFPHEIIIKKGETIHTENSHKFKPEQAEMLGMIAGLQLTQSYHDANRFFSLNLYEKPL